MQREAAVPKILRPYTSHTISGSCADIDMQQGELGVTDVLQPRKPETLSTTELHMKQNGRPTFRHLAVCLIMCCILCVGPLLDPRTQNRNQ